MKVTKFFDTKKFPLLSKSIDSVLLRVDYPWRFDSMIFILDDTNYFKLKDGEAEIHLDYGLVYHEDERFLKSAVMRIIFAMITSLNNMSTGVRIIDEILANREMSRKGFGEDLFYYYYLKFLGKKEIDTIEKYIEMNVPWLSIEGYDSQVLREMVERISSQHGKAFQRKAKKLLDVLSKDLNNEKNLKNAIKWHKKIA